MAQKFNHEAATIDEAIGLDTRETMTKAQKAYESDASHSPSTHVEQLELTLTKRELAFMVSILTDNLIMTQCTITEGNCTCSNCVERRKQAATLPMGEAGES